MEHPERHREKHQKFDQRTIDVKINATKRTITLRGDLSGTYETKMRLSQALADAPRGINWTIDADEIRFDEAGVAAWAEYVHLLLMDSALTYLPSQLGTILYFDDGLVYRHPRSHFEGV
jgi:hypothetical protein